MSAQRLSGPERGSPVTITVNGQPVQAYAGESIAAALLAAGWRVFRRTHPGGAPRGFFCGMGICFDCLVTVDGVPNVRSCMAKVREGCVVEVGTTADRVGPELKLRAE
jgi:aerobic-type carbon monoxide dehydrogenase small subunit (CoxS/CutS family)